jgi:cytoplasmic iron level regulating protein YaaA (DUF328/UPF0246 family)
MHRLLILACGKTKSSTAGLLPAIDRYDGPPARTVRKALRELAEVQRPTVLILSAEFGLITAATPIPTYDRRMTASRAVALRGQVRAALAQVLAAANYDATLINLGADYLPAFNLEPALRVRLGVVTNASGGIGQRMRQMKRWLLAADLTDALP